MSSHIFLHCWIPIIFCTTAGTEFFFCPFLLHLRVSDSKESKRSNGDIAPCTPNRHLMEVSGHLHFPTAFLHGIDPHLLSEKQTRQASKPGLDRWVHQQISCACRVPYYDISSSDPHIEYTTMSPELRQDTVSLPHYGRSMAQAVSRRPHTTETRVWSWSSTCGVCGGKSNNGTGFQTSFPLLLPLTNARFLLISLLWKSFNCGSWQHRETTRFLYIRTADTIPVLYLLTAHFLTGHQITFCLQRISHHRKAISSFHISARVFSRYYSRQPVLYSYAPRHCITVLS